jgi:hypothetical protein
MITSEARKVTNDIMIHDHLVALWESQGRHAAMGLLGRSVLHWRQRPLFSFMVVRAASFLKDGTVHASTIRFFLFPTISGFVTPRKWVCLSVCTPVTIVPLVLFVVTPQHPRSDVPAKGVIWLLIVFGTTAIAVPRIASFHLHMGELSQCRRLMRVVVNRCRLGDFYCDHQTLREGSSISRMAEVRARGYKWGV